MPEATGAETDGFMEEKADKNWMNNHFASAEMVKMDLQERLNKSRRLAAEEEVALEKTGGGRRAIDEGIAGSWRFGDECKYSESGTDRESSCGRGGGNQRLVWKKSGLSGYTQEIFRMISCIW